MVATTIKSTEVVSLAIAVKQYFYSGAQALPLMEFREEYKKLTDADKSDLKSGLRKEGYNIAD